MIDSRKSWATRTRTYTRPGRSSRNCVKTTLRIDQPANTVVGESPAGIVASQPIDDRHKCTSIQPIHAVAAAPSLGGNSGLQQHAEMKCQRFIVDPHLFREF